MSKTKNRNILLYFILVAGLLHAGLQQGRSQPRQNQQIFGTITDEETGDALPGVHVYISQTTVGTVTADDGTFQLTPELSGPYKLVASYVGYLSATNDLNLERSGPNITLNIELSHASEELGKLEVNASNSEWQGYFERFKESFLGTSEYAKESIIENAWSLNFEEDEEGNLIAKANQPLRITNYPLGYEIEVELVQFKWNREQDSGLYVIYTKFKEQQTDSKRQRREWLRNRENAYKGSFEHFLKSLYEDELTANRFETVLKDTDNRIQISELIRASDSRINVHTRSAVSSEHTKSFQLRGPTDILYGRNSGYSDGDERIRSRIIPMSNSGIFVVTREGRLVNPSSLRIQGAWKDDRIADLLPVTYSLED